MPWSLRTSSASTVPREPQRPAGVGRRGRAATGLVTTGALAAAASLATAPAEAAADLWSSRIAAGAWAPMTTAAGVPFAADRGFVGASSVVDSGVPIARTADDAFYQRNRWGMDAYRLDVPCAAQYDVTLHFAEIVFRDPGRRVFDVDVEDSGRQRVDVVAAVGPHAALSLTRRVPVVDGRVDITFHDVVDDAMVSALEVVQATTCDEVAPPAPPTPGPTTLPTPPPTTCGTRRSWRRASPPSGCRATGSSPWTSPPTRAARPRSCSSRRRRAGVTRCGRWNGRAARAPRAR